MAKRYPHPDGPRREIGTVLPIDEDTASRWEHNGIVCYVDSVDADPAPIVALSDMTKAQLTAEAELLGIDLDGAKTKSQIYETIWAELVRRGGETDETAQTTQE
jgi:hypothetical protein